MAGRPEKHTVDYFPHYTKDGKTLFILESQYKNDGYAFWFKLLTILSGTNNHIFDTRNTADWQGRGTGMITAVTLTHIHKYLVENNGNANKT